MGNGELLTIHASFGEIARYLLRKLRKAGRFRRLFHERKNLPVMDDALYPFGFGLTYTSFKIGIARLSKTTFKANEIMQLTVPVTNTGKRDGAEVVQVYIRKGNDMEGPLKTLRGFKRLEIPAGKTQQVSIDMDASSFEFFDMSQRKMMATPGEYEIFYGSSSDTEDLKSVNISILQ